MAAIEEKGRQSRVRTNSATTQANTVTFYSKESITIAKIILRIKI